MITNTSLENLGIRQGGPVSGQIKAPLVTVNTGEGAPWLNPKQVGGAAGMYLGAKGQKFIPAKWIQWMLAGIIVVIVGRYIWALVTAACS